MAVAAWMATQPDAEQLTGGHHDPAWFIEPGAYPEREVFAPVRLPVSWYGSLYNHAIAKDRFEQLRAWGNGSTHFPHVLYGWTHPAEVDVPECVGVIFTPCLPDMDTTQADMATAMRTSGYGLATWTVLYMLGSRYDWRGRWEDATWRARAVPLAGLAGYLGEPVPRQNTRYATPADRTLPAGYESAYTAEMHEWVRAADAPLLRLIN